MNNLKYISLFIILLFTGIACTNLDEVWYSAVTPETFFKTEKDVNAALYRPFTHARWYVENDRWRLRNILLINLLLQQRPSLVQWR